VYKDKTYVFEDIEAGEFSGTSLAVVGHPIKHSISPAMHNAALAQLSKTDGRFKDWTYYRFDIPQEQLAAALPLFHRRNFRGLNLTIPHKVAALNLIEEISPEAQSMGAVNTLVRNETGYSGLNTDGYGLERGLELDLRTTFKRASVMVLGAGGAARAAAVRAILSGCAQLYIGNRSQDRLQDLVNILNPISGETHIRPFNLNDLPRDLPESGVVVNATALGLKSDDPAPIDIAQLTAKWKVYDMIYNPSKTALLNEAEARGLKVANGLSMLVHQGARALEIWTNKTVSASVMMKAACAALE
jgi:shikimate dehydrogenase